MVFCREMTRFPILQAGKGVHYRGIRGGKRGKLVGQKEAKEGEKDEARFYVFYSVYINKILQTS